MMRRFAFLGLYSLVGLGLLGMSAPCRAGDPPPMPQRSWLNPLYYRDLVYQEVSRVKHLEAVEMVQAIVGGSQMRSGEGWFHPGESRYTWAWLAAHCNVDSTSRRPFVAMGAIMVATGSVTELAAGQSGP